MRDDLAQVLARAVDSAALVGPAGSAIEPLGIIYTTGRHRPIAAGRADYDLLVDITTSPATLNALEGSWAGLANFDGARRTVEAARTRYNGPTASMCWAGLSVRLHQHLPADATQRRTRSYSATGMIW